MATYRDYQPTIHDDFFTKEKEWQQIAPYIPSDKIISMPFYSPYSNCNELLGKIIYKNEDFFDHDRGDIVVDNPPFSIKKKIIKELFNRDKPFMLIVPISTISYRYAKILKNHIQILIFDKRPKFIKCNINGELTDHNHNPSFECIVLCYKMNFEKDIIFLK